MVNNLLVQLSAKMPSLGITSSSVPEGVGEGGSPAPTFTDLLQAIISGLDKGTGNLETGSIISADGKTASSEKLMELMQKLSNGKGIGSDKKSASGNSMTDMLQQMMTQLQASFAQPVTFTAPYQSNNASTADTSSIAATGVDTGNGAGALIAALETAIQKGDVNKQGVIDSPELPAAGQTAGQQLDMGCVPLPLTQDTIVTDQNAPVAAQDNAKISGGNLELAAFSAAAQKSLTNNTARPAQSTGTLNIGNAATQNAGNAVTLNIGNAATQNAANAATLNIGNAATQSAANAATLNIGNAATQNAANDTAQNTANSSMQNSEPGALTSLTGGTTGGLFIKEMSLTLNNENKSSSGDAKDNTAFSNVVMQQTPIANDSKPAQETLPVNKLNELSDPIMKTLGSGEKNLVIKLSPPDMGTIEIRLKVENGVLTADFKVDSTAVRDLFSVAMPQIKNSIESAGIKTGNFFADLKDDRSTDGGRQQDTNQQQQRQQKEQKQGFFDYFA